MFKDSLNQLILELEKNESLKDEVAILRKLAEDPNDPKDSSKDMGPAKDDLNTDKAQTVPPAYTTETPAKEVVEAPAESGSEPIKVGDKVKLVKEMPELPVVPVGAVGDVVNTDTPEKGLIGVEWEGKIGYVNMRPEEIERIKIVKNWVDASLNKEAVETKEKSDVNKVADILKNSPKKRKLFTDMVENSFKFKEISAKDKTDWDSELVKISQEPEAEEHWVSLAEMAIKLFDSTKSK